MTDLISLILNSPGECIYGVDTNDNCTFVNKQFLNVLGFSNFDEIVGKNMQYLIHQSNKDSSSNIKNSFGISKSILAGECIEFEKATIWRKDGTAILVEYSSFPQYKKGLIIGTVLSFKDFSKRIEYKNSLISISNHDLLTGLYNRHFFAEEYKRMDNPNCYPLGVLMVDVNGLKIVNDAFGNKAGDIALKSIARIFKKSIRKQDIVARIGGDEFVALLPKVTVDEIEKIKIVLMKGTLKLYVESINISVATGYAIKHDNSEGNLDEIMRLAENHLLRHKIVEGGSFRSNAIKSILKVLTDKYAEERIHSEKVKQLCRKTGIALELNERDIKELELAGMYHDIGKISIPDAILNKPGRLTKDEFSIMKTHPVISYQILRAADKHSDLAIHALYHHERWDGKGYPSGKSGEDIPLFSRIVCIVDAYDAMTSVRMYKDKMTLNYAVKEIISCSGTQFDERIAKIFVTKVLNVPWK